VPLISRFRGIEIYVYQEFEKGHRLPHFHAYYAEYAASFGVRPLQLRAGRLPHKQLRLVLEWAELHQAEIEENCHLVNDGKPVRWIEGI
jgi:hypothetical protein